MHYLWVGKYSEQSIGEPGNRFIMTQIKKDYNSLSIFQFFSVGFFILLFTVLLILNPEAYDSLSREDLLIENLTSVFLAVAGFFFFRSSFFSIKNSTFEYRWWRTGLLMFAGLLFLVAAAEEISWGQRIFNFETPEQLLPLNDQNEFNFHNIDKKFFDRAVDRVTIAFVFAGTVLVFMRKRSILGIKTPDILVISAFAIIPFYHQYN